MRNREVEGRAGGVMAFARGDRVRLEFLLELGHELRTPAGIVAGYLALARQGEMPLEEAVEVAAAKADELCALLDALLRLAQEQLAERGRWGERIGMAHEESERLRAQTAAAMDSARALLERLRSRSAEATQ